MLWFLARMVSIIDVVNAHELKWLEMFFLCVFVALVGACKVVEWPGYLLIEILF